MKNKNFILYNHSVDFNGRTAENVSVGFKIVKIKVVLLNFGSQTKNVWPISHHIL